MATRTNFVLVDFENVQPKDIDLLKDGPFKVKIFLPVYFLFYRK